MRRAIILAVVVTALLVFTRTVFADDGAAGKDAKASTAPASTTTETIFSGSWRVRMESWSWFDSSTGTPDYTFGASVLRLSLAQKRARWDWQLEAEQPTLIGLPDHASAPAPQGALGLGGNYFSSNGTWSMNIFPRQGYVRLHSLDRKTGLTLGRFEFVEGAEAPAKDATVATLAKERIAHRLVGHFGFSHVGRSFDGASLIHNAGQWNFTAMAGRATRGVFQTDGWGDLDVDIQYAALTRSFQQSTGQWRVFGLGYHDGRETLKADNRSAAARAADHQNIRIGTIGANAVKAFHTRHGTADVLAWGGYQFGSWGTQTQRASAGAVEAGYCWNAAGKPWLRAGYFRGSGDGNASDGTHGTFFQMLPTPRIYARFPFFNLMNNEDTFAEFMVTPAKRLKLRADAHVLRLSNAADAWYSGGGAYDQKTFGFAGRPSNGSRALANLYDASADLQINKHVTLTGYTGYAQGKSVIQRIYKDGTGLFGYLEMNYGF